MLKLKKAMSKTPYKIVFPVILAGTILLPAFSFAQGGDLPCGGDDPTTSVPCPLDTWVWVLVALAMVFGAIYMQRSQKVLQKKV